MKVLIAGSTGIVGTEIFNYLTMIKNLYDYHINRITIRLDNIASVKQFAKECEPFNVLIFLVAIAHKKGTNKSFNDFNRINYLTVKNLINELELNHKLPDKIIYTSTISVYGERYNQRVYKETLTPEPFSPYAITKLKAENYLINNFNEQSWILRLAPVYSKKFVLNIEQRTKLFNTFFKIGSGSTVLSLCNIINVTQTVHYIINNIVPQGVYNLSDARDYTYLELLKSRNARLVVRIPTFIIKSLYYGGIFFNNRFIKENTIKLISDNVFTSEKIRRFISLDADIKDLT